MVQFQSSFMKGFSEAYLADLGRVVLAWSHIEAKFDISRAAEELHRPADD
jgi:hypothetical protein